MRGAIIAPMEGEYGDQEGHAGRSFGWPATRRLCFRKTVFSDELKKALAERALNAEMDHHLAGGGETAKNRNGYGQKTVVTDTGKLTLDVPRDRQASFDPQLIGKYQRRFPGFDEKIISMYARGMRGGRSSATPELYGVDVSPDLISGHRRGSGGSRRLAGPPPGGGLSSGFLRRPAREDP